MKTITSSLKKQTGNALFLTVVFTGLVAFLLVSYLHLVKVQNYNVARSQAWNSQVAVIEAGIQDALTHLNVHGETNIGCDGWQKHDTYYWVKRPVGEGYYFAAIEPKSFGSVLQPQIRAYGFVPRPPLFSSQPWSVIAAVDTMVTTAGYMGRGVKVATRGERLFSKAMAADGKIDMNGKNVETDSFDSLDPNHSTDGRYDRTKRKDNGDVATNLRITNSMTIGNAKIMGRVSTGPKGTVGLRNACVGSLDYHATTGSGIQTGYSSDDMNIQFMDVKAPTFSGVPPQPFQNKIVDGVTYRFVLDSGNYEMNYLNMSSSEKMLVLGNVTLYVRGAISMSGQSQIIVAPTNASMKLYAKGPIVDLGGSGVMNKSGFATNFCYFGLTNNTLLKMTGNGEFTGLIYAPDANLILNGGGAAYEDFIGASITKTVTMNGHYKFHYDEALRKVGPFSGFIITGWDEMTPQDMANLPVSLSGP